MGCDIHAFIEFSHSSDKHQHWQSVGRDFVPPRNYDLFGLLAGVRGEARPLYPERGMPRDCGFWAAHGYTLFVAPNSSGEGRDCTPAQAEEWLRDGKVERWGGGYITDPDWHTASHLTTAEYADVIDAYRRSTDRGLELAYVVILGALVAGEEYGYRGRLVFWFDN